jgi:hypothetical protein
MVSANLEITAEDQAATEVRAGNSFESSSDPRVGLGGEASRGAIVIPLPSGQVGKLGLERGPGTRRPREAASSRRKR